MTDSTDSNSSQAKVLDHSVDGICELDNPLPRWWLMLFYSTIVWSIGYALYYPSLWCWPGLKGWSQEQQWSQQVAAAPKKKDPGAIALGELAQQATVIAEGKKVFLSTCASCHGTQAEGKIGPCLSDSEWKYGSSDKDLLQSIRKGRPGGMPAWETFLKPDQVAAVAAYVHTLSLKPGGR